MTDIMQELKKRSRQEKDFSPPEDSEITLAECREMESSQLIKMTEDYPYDLGMKHGAFKGRDQVVDKLLEYAGQLFTEGRDEDAKFVRDEIIDVVKKVSIEFSPFIDEERRVAVMAKQILEKRVESPDLECC